MLTLRDLLQQPPTLIHEGRPIRWGIRPALAEFLDDAVGPGWVTLETGAGLSTLVILRKQPRQHTAVQPMAHEFAVILEFAARHEMDVRGFRPIVARSQDWLPGGDLAELDLVLVNGVPTFPIPVLDWYYGAEKLKVGGLMVIDETRLLPMSTAADFMEADPQWEQVVRDGANFFSIYRKRAQPRPSVDRVVQPAADLSSGSHRVLAGTAPRAAPPSVVEPVGRTGPQLACVEVRSWDEYQHYRAAMVGEQRRREAVELALVDFTPEQFHIDGYCGMCQRATRFGVRFTYSYQRTEDGQPIPNWREHLVCTCGFNNRMRAAVQVLRQELRPPPDARVYLTERLTMLYQWLRARYPNLVGTEYLGDTVLRGAEKGGIRNEDPTALTFPDESFDLILSFDVMEHVPDSDAALAECFRCLRPGGTLLFGAPFRLDSPGNVERARLRADGTLEHFLPPEYHWQPLTSAVGALSFREFGWTVLEQMKNVGFSDPRALLYWSLELGHLGGDQVLLIASRPARGGGGR